MLLNRHERIMRDKGKGAGREKKKEQTVSLSLSCEPIDTDQRWAQGTNGNTHPHCFAQCISIHIVPSNFRYICDLVVTFPCCPVPFGKATMMLSRDPALPQQKMQAQNALLNGRGLLATGLTSNCHAKI